MWNCCVTYHTCDVHWKDLSDFTRYANLMRFWSDYIHYFVHILFKLSLTLNFNVSFIYYFNFNRRIKCGEKVWLVLAQFIWGRSTVCKLRCGSLWTIACVTSVSVMLSARLMHFSLFWPRENWGRHKKVRGGGGERREGNACTQTPRFWKTPLWHLHSWMNS